MLYELLPGHRVVAIIGRQNINLDSFNFYGTFNITNFKKHRLLDGFTTAMLMYMLQLLMGMEEFIVLLFTMETDTALPWRKRS